MKIDILTVQKPKEFFTIEQNNLNNQYMVFSPFAQLPQCYHFKRKSEANKLCVELNKQANNEYDAFVYKETHKS